MATFPTLAVLASLANAGSRGVTIADTLWSDVHLEVGVDRAYRDQVWAQASVTESHANGRLRWTPRHLGGYFSPSARPSLELVADLRERRSGGDAELADPTLMLIWTVR